MGSRLIDYAFLNSRIAGMYSRFLTPDDIQLLVKADGVPAFYRALIKTNYSEFLAGIRPDEIAAPLLESVLFAALFDCFQKIIPSLTDAADVAFLKKLLLVFELRNVKTIIRGKVTGRAAGDLRKDLINIGKYSVINTEFLIGAKDLEEAVAYLEKHPVVGGIIRFAYERYKKEKNLYVLDSSIDTRYLADLYTGIQRLNPYDRTRLRKLYGTQMDLNNILWALRLKFIYGVDPREIMVDLVPEYYEYDEKFFKNIVFEPEIKNVFAVLLKLPWTKYVKQEAVTIGDIERGFGMYYRDLAFTMFRKDAFSLSSIAGFLFIKRAEVALLVKILESKEYHLPADELEKGMRTTK